jgi:3'-phosphoadenosine 5'-phosphosulfate sulfotransferase
VQTRREFLGTAIGNHNSIKQHDREVQAQDLQASDRRDMEDLLVIEAVKGGSRSVRERIRNSNVEIMRATSRISICVSRKKDKLIRSRKLLEQHTDRDLFTKLGLLNQEQIARHNSELMRKMSVLESSAPTAGLM